MVTKKLDLPFVDFTLLGLHIEPVLVQVTENFMYMLHVLVVCFGVN